MLKIVRDDIVRIKCDAIVNTANEMPTYSTGVDSAIYQAAGAELLLAERQKIGAVPEGEVFVTDAYNIPVKKIIHAVSPMYIDGHSGEEEKLRNCYRKSLEVAKTIGMKSVAFPLIATGNFGYPIEAGMRIAVEEISVFLDDNDPDSKLLVYLVVFNAEATVAGRKYASDLRSYIDERYVEAKLDAEYMPGAHYPAMPSGKMSANVFASPMPKKENKRCEVDFEETSAYDEGTNADRHSDEIVYEKTEVCCESMELPFEELEDKLNERLKHLKDTFSEYLMYIIESRGMVPSEVYKSALVSKKVFSKIKNDPDYHPSKSIALRLCVGAHLNIDETKDLLARAGYAFSPCSLTDLIYEFFIENEIFDMIEIDIQLEEHGIECIID